MLVFINSIIFLFRNTQVWLKAATISLDINLYVDIIEKNLFQIRVVSNVE